MELEALRVRSDVPRALHALREFRDDPFIDLLLLELSNEDVAEIQITLGAYEPQRICTILEQLSTRLATMGQAWIDGKDVVRSKTTPEELAKVGNLSRKCRAFFSQEELVRFCRSGRYEINPLNIASAMAGVPAIGWRQSMKRCLELQNKGLLTISNDGMPFGTFALVNSLCSYVEARNTTGADVEFLRRSASAWLKNAHSQYKQSLKDLRRHWKQLLQAVENVYMNEHKMKERPSLITREYFRLCTQLAVRNVKTKLK